MLMSAGLLAAGAAAVALRLAESQEPRRGEELRDAAPLATAASQRGASSPGTGYVWASQGASTVDAEFVDIQVSHGVVSGTASQSALDNGVVVTSTTRVTGKLSGAHILLRLSELSPPWMFGAVTPDLAGTLSDGVLTLTVVKGDGALVALPLHRGGADVYWSAVERMSAEVAGLPASRPATGPRPVGDGS